MADPEKFASLMRDIEETLPKSPLDFELVHARLVFRWLLKLKPDAGEALKIAALAHDIERAITGITEKDLKDSSKLPEFKREHALRSARIVEGMMEKHGYGKELIREVGRLVENHESGGNAESDVLMEADSLAFFEYNIPFKIRRDGKEKVIAKIGSCTPDYPRGERNLYGG
jgi:hypothetical protein